MARGVSEWNAVRRGLYGLAAGLVLGGMIMASVLPGRGLIAGGLAVLALAGAIAAGFQVRRLNPIALGAGDDVDVEVMAPLARAVFAQLPDPLMLLDASGRVLFANAAMASVVGLDAQSKHVSSVWRVPAVLQAVARTLEDGAPTTGEFSTPVPVARHYQVYARRIDQAPHLTVLLLHDVSAVKRAEQARADFIANASHELRTPLAAVSGFIDTLRGHAKNDEAAREQFLAIMSEEAGRMRRLIEDLMSLTRIELNEHVPPSGDVDVGDAVRNAVASLQGLANADDVTVSIAAPPASPHVAGERDELIQLFQNLIHNAIKYGREHGHVWIEFSQSSAPLPGRRGAVPLISISIRDDGEGIAREAIPRLTERFYRVDVKRSRERGGTGLGLAIVKHIVNRHGGRLQIESKPGEGSTFTVILPVRTAAA
ncbi:MAG TPA: ATP-binding protein [Rhizomicrobium sp.]|jgi:two-component system phosphate regulon sensor histidine kinase PhoR